MWTVLRCKSVQDKGWDVPETWDDMWALADKAKADGISLFTYPTTRYFDAFFYALLHETMGSEDFTKALNYAEGIWDTDGAKKHSISLQSLLLLLSLQQQQMLTTTTSVTTSSLFLMTKLCSCQW